MRTTESRAYRMRRRAEQVDQTRQRITEAAVHLHTTVGPANTSISALAATAGVTRVTVYRHFSDEEELFAACRGHWMLQHPPPDPTAWLAIPGVAERAPVALGELYGWYRDNADDLHPIQRDVAAMPAGVQATIEAENASLAETLVHGCGLRGRRRRLLRAAAGHLVSYWTWRSLAVEQDLPHDDTVALAVELLRAAAEG